MLITRMPGWLKVICYLGLTLAGLIYISPYLWMIMSSFRPSTEPFALGIFPHSWTIQNYIRTLKDPDLTSAFFNSFKVAFSSASSL